MQCYTELLPPTAVTHAVSLPLLGPDTTDLVVAKTSLLQVFNVARTLAGEERLALVGEYPLSGTVTSLARVKTLDTKTGGEALLVAFKDAKLSLVEWDPESHRIGTVSIHFYEGENIITQPFGPSLGDCESILTVDPSSRCAALKFGARQLAILPFRQFGDELAGEEEDGMDTELASTAQKRRESGKEGEETEETPYKASFVLPLTALDPSLSHTVHLAFLHEYREPTFGILSSQIEPSNTLLDERKDTISYTVFTIDLEQRASTNLITVPKLPSSLWKVIPLPLPIGGALLVGTNELVHVDQSGKANATAVNEFAKLESDFGMADQSHLNMKLENCSIEILDVKTGELLLVLQDGSLAILSFQISGRSISSINVTRVSAEYGGDSIKVAPSSIARLESNKLFIGSEDGASSLLGWSRPNVNLSRKRSHAQMLGKAPNAEDDDEDEMEEDDDDDLYDAAPETKKRALPHSGVSAADAKPTFAVKDTLRSVGPINDICLGRSSDARGDMLQLFAGTGRQRSGCVTCMNRDIAPKHVRTSELKNAKSAWAIRSNKSASKDTNPGADNLLFVYDGQNTTPYEITTSDADVYVERAAAEFENEGETVEVQTLAQGSIVVQCRRSEIRTYDSNLTMLSIIPMVDDETDQEFNIVHTAFCDPYMLVIRDDSSVQVLQVQGKEVELVEGEGPVVEEKKWLSGCVYDGSLTNNTSTLFLLSAQGSMHAFSLPDLKPVFSIPVLPQLPPVFAADATQRRTGTKEHLVELLVADIGLDGVAKPYVIVRTATDDIVLYEPFTYPQPSTAGSWSSGLRFRKVPVPYIPKYTETISEQDSGRAAVLKRITVGSYSAVTIQGAPPCLLLKEASSLPKILEVRQPENANRVTTLLPISRPQCEQGFAAIVEDGELQEFQLPDDTWYGTGWSTRQLDLGGEIRRLAYHETKGMYVVATCRNVDFYFAEEDGRHPEQDDISLRPQVPQYSVHLVSSQSHKILHTFEMPYLETITALKIMPLEISENSHKQEFRIVVASAAQRGEDMPAKGAVTVFDILDVVPDPDVPESGCKLQIVAREESRGAITALAAFPGGFIGTAQGQKILIRGLKEDGSCLPVAFLDAQCHTNTMKTLGGRGMWLAGDAWKGLWFGGFTEEPYKITVLGKSPNTQMEVMAADFLPFDGSLYLVIIDADMDLHALQYDPENPKTVNGLRLLHKSTFHIGHFSTTMTLLPSTLSPFAQQETTMNGTNGHVDAKPPPSLYHVLTTSLTGSIGLITPLDEAAYRRLSALQTHLTAILEHAAGLNPRAYRVIESESGGGGRGVVDGSLVRRISELGAARKADVLSRVGADEWTLRSDLEIVGGGGLGYL